MTELTAAAQDEPNHRRTERTGPGDAMTAFLRGRSLRFVLGGGAGTGGAEAQPGRVSVAGRSGAGGTGMAAATAASTSPWVRSNRWV